MASFWVSMLDFNHKKDGMLFWYANFGWVTCDFFSTKKINVKFFQRLGQGIGLVLSYRNGIPFWLATPILLKKMYQSNCISLSPIFSLQKKNKHPGGGFFFGVRKKNFQAANPVVIFFSHGGVGVTSPGRG